MPTTTTKKHIPGMKGKEHKEPEVKRFVKHSKIMKKERLKFIETHTSDAATVMYETRLMSKSLGAWRAAFLARKVKAAEAAAQRQVEKAAAEAMARLQRLRRL